MAEQASPHIEQQIRCRAYELYKQRGGTEGHDQEDGLVAGALGLLAVIGLAQKLCLHFLE